MTDFFFFFFPHVSACLQQKLKVLFAVGCDGEVSEPLEVNALSCDTVEQVKGKILASFKAKFGFPYCTPLGELRVGEQKFKGPPDWRVGQCTSLRTNYTYCAVH